MGIAENLQSVWDKIPENVTLVAVSKTKPASDILTAYNAGQRIFGENKVQEMAEKAAVLPTDIAWHMIGHVQTNKIKYMAPFVSLVHGVDRCKVLHELNKEAEKAQRTIDFLLQIYIANEDTKFGFSTDEARQIFRERELENYKNLRLRGLMGMATFTEDLQQVRQEFRSLKNLFDELQSTFNLEPSTFNILSMGMSGDYHIAIEEGSTMIRIGTALFGGRN